MGEWPWQFDQARHEQAAELVHLGARRRAAPAGSPTQEIEPVVDLHRARQEHRSPGVDGEDGVGHQPNASRRRRRTAGRTGPRETRMAPAPPSTVTSTLPSASRPPTAATAPGMKPPSSSRVSEPRLSSTSSLMRRRRTRSPAPTSASGRVADGGRRRVRARDRVAVRAGGGVAQQLDQAGLDVVGDHVLPAPRLAVHLVPLEPDDVDQEALGQAVLAHHLLRQRPPARRSATAAGPRG